MELEVVIVLIVGLGFVSIIAFKVFRDWTRSEERKYMHSSDGELAKEIQFLKKELDVAQNGVRNWKHRYKLARTADDFDFDDDELEELEANASNPERLSELVEQLFPQLPKSLTKLLDKPALQDAIGNYVQKNPEALGGFLEKFLPSKTDSTVKTTEQYGV